MLIGVPLMLAVLVGVPLGLSLGPYQWLCAAVAVALTIPPGVVTLIMADRLARSSPHGRVAALFIGTFVRLAVGFGGAVVVYVVNKPTFRPDPFSFWLWLLGMYLTTLVVEMALLGQPAGCSSNAS